MMLGEYVFTLRAARTGERYEEPIRICTNTFIQILVHNHSFIWIDLNGILYLIKDIIIYNMMPVISIL